MSGQLKFAIGLRSYDRATNHNVKCPHLLQDRCSETVSANFIIANDLKFNLYVDMVMVTVIIMGLLYRLLK